MTLEDFHYELPKTLIAQDPIRRRDQARLMVVDRKQQRISHDIFANIRRYLPVKSCLVLNDSKVIPARLFGKRASGGKAEILLLKKLPDGYSYKTMMRPLRRLKVGEQIIFDDGRLVAKVQDRENKIVRFNKRNISAQLDRVGHIPLPPYIKRSDRAADSKYYQTVYAQREGSVASPTAGLHFTNTLLKRIANDGHRIAKVTLHINYATFKPVVEQDITKHEMHGEEYSMTGKAWKTVEKAKAGGHKVVAVGTSSCRVLETVAATGLRKGNTDIFIYPSYVFRMTDVLVTNFHLPYSTLLMLVYAFGTKELIAGAYREAIKKKYRFYSYGDAMMIL